MAWPPGVVQTSPAARPNTLMNAATIELPKPNMSANALMVVLMRPVADPSPRVISIKKKITAKNCGANSNLEITSDEGETGTRLGHGNPKLVMEKVIVPASSEVSVSATEMMVASWFLYLHLCRRFQRSMDMEGTGLTGFTGQC